MNVQKIATLTLASARLSRLVTRDKLGKWLIQDPIDRAMDRYAQRRAQAFLDEIGDTSGMTDEDLENALSQLEPWWWKYRSGLECSWCVGFWLTLGVVAGERATRPGTPTVSPRLEALRPILGTATIALALNYLTATLETINPANSEDVPQNGEKTGVGEPNASSEGDN